MHKRESILFCARGESFYYCAALYLGLLQWSSASQNCISVSLNNLPFGIFAAGFSLFLFFVLFFFSFRMTVLKIKPLHIALIHRLSGRECGADVGNEKRLRWNLEEKGISCRALLKRAENIISSGQALLAEGNSAFSHTLSELNELNKKASKKQ